MAKPATTRAVHDIQIEWEPGWQEVLIILDPSERPLSMKIDEYRSAMGLGNQVMNAIDRAARNVHPFPRPPRPRKPAAHAKAPAPTPAT